VKKVKKKNKKKGMITLWLGSEVKGRFEGMEK